jgi:hypothetical protein
MARGCKRFAALGMHYLPVDYEAYLLFSCPAAAVVRRERQFAQLPSRLLQDLCSRDVYKVALLVVVEREFVAGNDLPRIVAHRCIIEASIGKRIVQTIKEPHSSGHREFVTGNDLPQKQSHDLP